VWLGKSLKIKAKASPEYCKANAAAIELLAAKLDIDRGLIEVVSGWSSVSNLLSIPGLGDCLIRALLKRISA
jgi:uncharacterized protein